MGSDYRYVPVKIGNTEVQVRVISQHESDDEVRVKLSELDDLWDWIESQDKLIRGFWKSDAENKPTEWVPPAYKPDDVEKAVSVKAKLSAKRDKLRRELAILQLSDKQTKEQIEGMLRQCSLPEIRVLYWAMKNVDMSTLLSQEQLKSELNAAMTPSGS